MAHSHGWKDGSPPHHCLQEAAWASSQYGNWLSPQLHIKKTKEGAVMLLWPSSGSHVSAYPLHSIVNLGQPWFNVKGTIQRARIPGDKDHWGNPEGWVEWVSPEISVTLTVCLCVCVLSCVRLFVTLLDCSSPGSSVHGNFQARILDGLSFPPPGDLSNLGIHPGSPALQANSLLLSHRETTKS